MKWITAIIISVACGLVSPATSFAKTASCPCNPCRCGVCTCGGGGSGGGGKSPTGGGDKGKSGDGGKTVSKGHEGGEGHGHHEGHGRHDGHSRSGGSVGVGISVDLGGIGHRNAEADPFAPGSAPQPVVHTQEKPKTKVAREPEPRTNAFDQVQLTGEQAKGDFQTIPISDTTAEATPPPTGPGGGNAPATMDDLKNAKTAYNDALTKFEKADPKWQKILADFAKTGVRSKILKISEQFKQTDEGKKLFANWLKAYQDVGKAGGEINRELVPPDKLEQAKYEVTTAQNELKSAHNSFNAGKDYAVSQHAGVKNIQAAIDELNKKPHYSEKDAQVDRDKLKQLQAELDKAKKQVANDWVASDEGKQEGKKIQAAEQQLDKAKANFKPYEALEHNTTKAASNP